MGETFLSTHQKCHTIIWKKPKNLYFKEHYKLIAIDLSGKQALDADHKANQNNDFTGKLGKCNNVFLLLKKAKKLFWIFHKELWECNTLCKQT